jgi:hypothetical protein
MKTTRSIASITGACAAALGLALGSLIAGTPGTAQATPSTTYWTPMTVDIQSYGVLHTGVDNYFTVFRKAEDGGGMFPTDVGLTMGVLPFDKVTMEVGVDLMESSDYPLFFNAKIGIPEDTFFPWQPTLQVGIFNAGTKSDVTNQNIVFGVIGKSIPGIGRFSVGPYIGNEDVLVNKDGEKENTGFMAAFDRAFLPSRTRRGTSSAASCSPRTTPRARTPSAAAGPGSTTSSRRISACSRGRCGSTRRRLTASGNGRSSWTSTPPFSEQLRRGRPHRTEA